MQINPKIALSGDAFISVLSHAQLLDIDHLIKCPADGIARLIDLYNSHNGTGWTGRDLQEELKALAGRAVYIQPDLGDALFVAELKLGSQPFSEVTQDLEALYPRLELLTANVLFYRTGFASVNATLRASGGWNDHSVVDAFAYERADLAFSVLAKLLTMLLSDAVKPIYRLIESGKIGIERLLNTGTPRLQDPMSIECQSMHLLYGGRIQDGFDYAHFDAAVMDDAYIPLIYRERPGSIANQSPMPNEFACLGYAFSLFGTSRDVERRCFELTLLVRLQHALFVRLDRFAGYWEKMDMVAGKADLAAVQAISYQLRREYLDFCSPTFTYRHEFLVLRNRLMQAWGVDRLFEKARSTLAFLEELSERAESRRRSSYERSLQVILLVIALLSVISVIADAQQIPWLARLWASP